MTKHLFILLYFFLGVYYTAFAQVPQGIPYQAVARNSQGQPMGSRIIKVRFSILDSVTTGTVVYSETHSSTTTDLGLFSLNIGMGNPITGTFNGINWGANSKFLKVEFDSTGTGSSYLDFGTQQMMSVPYALYAKSSSNNLPSVGSEGQILTVCNGTPIWTTGGQCPGRITALSCSSAVNNGTLTSGISASAVTSVLSYTGGNGGPYAAQSISSTGVTGLTAALSAGALANGSGSLTYTITGTPSASGTASFALAIGGQSCTLTRVISPAATVASLSCSSAVHTGTLTAGIAAGGVTSVISYTGGNGSSYAAQTVSSTGVTGLTASLAAGTLSSGSGTLTYTITGTPSASGTAYFTISMGTATCSLSRTVINGGSSGITSVTCGATNVLNASSTYGSLTDQDGNQYKTIVIGTQEWMAENLKVSHYRTGALIPVVTDGTIWGSLSTGATCWYNNDSTTYHCPYGKLYNFYAVADARNLCPTGWHIPTDSEWTVLSTYLGGDATAGGALKSAGTLYWVSPNSNATNSSGFSGLPCGVRNYGGAFNYVGYYGYWWSASPLSTTNVWYWYLYYSNGNVNRWNYSQTGGFSVRCLRD